MPLILQPGYEAAVRSRLGVKESELSDIDINQRIIIDLAERLIVRRVPEYATITDPTDLLYLESAVISYMCYLLCPSMARRVNLEVSTIDVKWKKDRVKWDELAAMFLAEVEQALAEIETIEISVPDHALMAIIKGPSAADTAG